MRLRPAVGLGYLAVGTGLLLLGLLHPLAAGRVDPVQQTLSEYAFGTHGWMFDLAVSLLSVGSGVLLLALLAARVLSWPSVGGLALLVWVIALPVLVAFEKADWSAGPSVSGYVHRYACLAAFVALPLAARAVGKRWRGDPVFGRAAAWARLLAGASFGWLAVIVLGMLLYPLAGLSLWPYAPLGLLERGLGVTEVAALLLLGSWAWRASALGEPAGRQVPAPGAAHGVQHATVVGDQ
jgi:hypothetical protein